MKMFAAALRVLVPPCTSGSPTDLGMGSGSVDSPSSVELLATNEFK